MTWFCTFNNFFFIAPHKVITLPTIAKTITLFLGIKDDSKKSPLGARKSKNYCDKNIKKNEGKKQIGPRAITLQKTLEKVEYWKIIG